MTARRHNRPPPRRVVESTAVLDRPAQHVGGRVTATETPIIITEASKPGRLLVQLISAGWSLNGRYYPAAVLKRDGPRAFGAGTLNYIDHATDDEDEARPAGSLMKLASYQTENARWDEARQALVAEVRLFQPWREAVTDWAESGAIGMSIRAWVYGEEGEVEGRRGYIVNEFESGRSVDYVTQPAAGGALLRVLESVQTGRTGGGPAKATEARTVGAWLESRLHLALTQLGDDMYGNGRLTRVERIVLSTAIGDGLQAWTARVEQDAPQLFQRDIWDEPETGETAADEARARATAEATSEEIRRGLEVVLREAYGGDGTYVWVRDYDADRSTVWYERNNADECATFQHVYGIGEAGAITLAGKPLQVVARTVYDPVPAAGPAVVTQAEAVVETAPAPINVSDGSPPTEPPNRTEEQRMTAPTGTPPGPAGTAVGTQAAPNADATAATARAELAEAQLATAQAQVSALTEAQTQAAREKARADAAEARSQRMEADGIGRDTVARMMGEAGIPEGLRALIAPRVTDRIVGRVPVVAESGAVNQEGLEAAITAAIDAEKGYAAALLEGQGAGTVRGLGATKAGEEISDKEMEDELADIFASTGMNEATARAAAKGRVA